MLSDLGEDFDQAVQELTDALSKNFSQLTQDIDRSAQNAAQTITDTFKDSGYQPTDSFESVLQESSTSAAASKMIAALEGFTQQMQSFTDNLSQYAVIAVTGQNSAQTRSLRGNLQEYIPVQNPLSENIPSLATTTSMPLSSSLASYRAARPEQTCLQEHITVAIDEVNLPNVRNYQEFRDGLIRDSKFEKAVQSMSVNQLAQRSSSFDKFQYLRF